MWGLTSSQGAFTLTLVHGMAWGQHRLRPANQSAHTGPLRGTGPAPSMAATLLTLPAGRLQSQFQRTGGKLHHRLSLA